MGMVTASAEHAEGESVVERVYDQVKAMAISFEFPPGGRLNELAIARQIGVSRTPLREALNRLAADGFLTISPKQGFFRKPLSVREIADFFDLRLQIERGVARLATARATEAGLDEIEVALTAFWRSPDHTSREIVEQDEYFHEQLAALTGNVEIVQGLRNFNERLRFIRWVHMDGRADNSQAEQLDILAALRAGDAERVETLIARQSMLGHDDIVLAVKDAFARIYMIGERTMEAQAR